MRQALLPWPDALTLPCLPRDGVGGVFSLGGICTFGLCDFRPIFWLTVSIRCSDLAEKANHHFIPQFYLRGFAEGMGPKAKVFTFDRETCSAFTTLVRNVGSRRHFFRVEIEGVHPNAIEDSMAEVEALFAAHLVDVIQARNFPSTDHFNSIMNILANMSVRNPRLRQTLVDFHRDVAERIMTVSLSSKRTWESQMAKMRDAGYALNDLTYEEMKAFNESKEYDIVVDQTHLISLEFKMLDPVLECSARRNWCFATAPHGFQYISSDDPVVLSWTKESDRRFPPPGHGLRGTSVLFPLSSDLLLIGAFEDLPKEMVHLPSQVVAANTHIARYSTKQKYARNGSFFVHLRDRDYVRGEDLPRYWPKSSRPTRP